MSAQRTLAIVKPDAVARRVVGKILTRIEDAGFTILAAKLVHMSVADARGFYSFTGSGRSTTACARS